MSSALIPLLSADVPFLSLLIAVCNYSLWNSHHLTRVFVLHIEAAFIFIIFVFFVVVKFFVEFSKDIGNYIPWRNDVAFLIL